MSVYTAVPEAALRAWLAAYRLGPLQACEGIAAGVENTNYFVDTDGGRYVLTLFERMSLAELEPYLKLMAHLAKARVSCPRPLRDQDGRLCSTLCGKPAALVMRLPGSEVGEPAPAHCAAIGRWLAEMHVAVTDFAPRWPNPRGAAWRETTAAYVLPQLACAERALLEQALRAQSRGAGIYKALPRGIVHADLFRDNALFAHLEKGVLGGVIDFYFAGEDALLFDLAVVANDWCRAADKTLDVGRTQALLRAYHARRPLSEAEKVAWPLVLQAAALRFWLSRLDDSLRPRTGEIVLTKDPAEYARILSGCLSSESPVWQ